MATSGVLGFLLAIWDGQAQQAQILADSLVFYIIIESIRLEECEIIW